MTGDPFDRLPLNANAVDLAWVHFHYNHLPLNTAVMEMVLTGGVTFDLARVYLACTTMPSTSGLMAATV